MIRVALMTSNTYNKLMSEISTIEPCYNLLIKEAAILPHIVRRAKDLMPALKNGIKATDASIISAADNLGGVLKIPQRLRGMGATRMSRQLRRWGRGPVHTPLTRAEAKNLGIDLGKDTIINGVGSTIASFLMNLGGGAPYAPHIAGALLHGLAYGMKKITPHRWVKTRTGMQNLGTELLANIPFVGSRAAGRYVGPVMGGGTLKGMRVPTTRIPTV